MLKWSEGHAFLWKAETWLETLRLSTWASLSFWGREQQKALQSLSQERNSRLLNPSSSLRILFAKVSFFIFRNFFETCTGKASLFVSTWLSLLLDFLLHFLHIFICFLQKPALANPTQFTFILPFKLEGFMVVWFSFHSDPLCRREPTQAGTLDIRYKGGYSCWASLVVLATLHSFPCWSSLVGLATLHSFPCWSSLAVLATLHSFPCWSSLAVLAILHSFPCWSSLAVLATLRCFPCWASPVVLATLHCFPCWSSLPVLATLHCFLCWNSLAVQWTYDLVTF